MRSNVKRWSIVRKWIFMALLVWVSLISFAHASHCSTIVLYLCYWHILLLFYSTYIIVLTNLFHLIAKFWKIVAESDWNLLVLSYKASSLFIVVVFLLFNENFTLVLFGRFNRTLYICFSFALLYFFLTLFLIEHFDKFLILFFYLLSFLGSHFVIYFLFSELSIQCVILLVCSGQ